MATGYVSKTTGQCVPTAQEAVGGICAGYPVVTFDSAGVSSVTWCSINAWETSYFGNFGFEVGGSYTGGLPISGEVAQCELQASPWELSVEDGLSLAGLILSVWAIAWAARALHIPVNQ